MSFIKQKRGSKWNKLSKRSTNQENELTPRDDLGLKVQGSMIPIKIGWIVRNGRWSKGALQA